MNKTEHEFCLRCGRRLKNPEARTIGYGAVCRRKIQGMGKNLLSGYKSCEEPQDIESSKHL